MRISGQGKARHPIYSRHSLSEIQNKIIIYEENTITCLLPWQKRGL